GQPEREGDDNASSACTIACFSSAVPSQQTMEESPFPSQPTSEEETTHRPATTNGVAVQSITVSSTEQPQAPRTPVRLQRSRQKSSVITLEQATQHYLEDQRSHHRRPKTLEWHRKALGLFLQYLRTEHECVLLGQMTEAQV